jgi:hypothetical protein
MFMLMPKRSAAPGYERHLKEITFVILLIQNFTQKTDSLFSALEG